MITVKNISKSFEKKVIINNLSFEFSPGEISLIKGNNGSGKSTLLKIMSFLIKPDLGAVYFSGKKIGFYDYKYRNKVGYLLDQPFYLEKLNPVEYLVFLLKAYQLYNSKSKSKIHYQLDEYRLPYNKLIENFSQGMKKKISLISATIHEPDYLLLDEPFTSLDNSAEKVFAKRLIKMKKNGCTIIIASPKDIDFIETGSFLNIDQY